MNQEVTLSTHNLQTLQPSTVNTTASIVDRLIHRIGPERFEMWFGKTESVRLLEEEGGRIAVAVFADNDFSLSRIKATFGKDLRQVVSQTLGQDTNIEFHISKDTQWSSSAASELDRDFTRRIICEQSAEKLSKQRSPIIFSFESSDQGKPIHNKNRTTVSSHPPLPPVRGLKSFWFGSENKLAQVSVEQIIEQPGQFSPLLVYGPTGCGKSELLQAIVADYRVRLRKRRCIMVSAEQFTSQFVNSLRGGAGLPIFRRKFRDLDLLVIDDIQFLLGKKATANEFQQTMDCLIRDGKQVVLASDRSPVELCSFSEELGNRLAGGLSCPLRYPELEGRIEIAHRICKTRNMSLSLEVIEFVCSRLTRDVRRISGALNRLHALAISNGQKITVDLAARELADLFSINATQSTSLTHIESAVCEICGIKPTELKSKKRHKSISTARMLAMYLSREHTPSACSEIGEYFGGRSHSTVIAAHKKVTNWIQSDAGISVPNAKLRASEIIQRLQVNLRVG